MKRYYRLGYAPFNMILSSLVFEDRKEATAQARLENRYGDYRGRGVKVYLCDQDGQLIDRPVRAGER